MTAEEVKEALRVLHPGTRDGSYPGRWTCLEEWCKIDLLALDAWRDAEVVGYEVKVSRSDCRAELLNPTKRMEAVSRCTRFYLAVPEGLLKPEEIAFKEPEWDLCDFERVSCPGPLAYDHAVRHGGRCINPRGGRSGRRSSRYGYSYRHYPKGSSVMMPVPAVLQPISYSQTGHGPKVYSNQALLDAVRDQGYQPVACPVCGGRGYVEPSRVERESPQLWVPRDVGLIEVRGTRAFVVRRAPKNELPVPIVGADSGVRDPKVHNRVQRQRINDMIRWTSNRPDPRHR